MFVASVGSPGGGPPVPIQRTHAMPRHRTSHCPALRTLPLLLQKSDRLSLSESVTLPPVFSTGSNAIFKMPIATHELTKGTHKGTFHIPGYQGFIPTNTSNPYCARVAGGADLREKKSMLTSQFHTNLLNYCGHTPGHPNNDNGGRKVDDVSTMGRNFQWPKQNAFPAM